MRVLKLGVLLIPATTKNNWFSFITYFSQARFKAYPFSCFIFAQMRNHNSIRKDTIVNGCVIKKIQLHWKYLFSINGQCQISFKINYDHDLYSK